MESIVVREASSPMVNTMPEIASERSSFAGLQQSFAAQFESVFPDRMAAKTVIILPGLNLDPEILQKIDGINYYEERLLCLLLLLRMPHTRVVYLTSMPVDPVIIDYYLHLLPGISEYHARQRLKFLSCFDASSKSLTEKILERPRLIKRIRESIAPDHACHLACFNVTESERKLAVALQIPVYGCDPDLRYLESKSFGRKIFRDCGIPVPAGVEDLMSEKDIIEALYSIKTEEAALKKAVIKINEGFSGEGNAIFYFDDAPKDSLLKNWIGTHLRDHLKIVASGMDYEAFIEKFSSKGGVVEAFVEGDIKFSPSVQCRINPTGKIEIISTHDQILGGEGGQVFLGASFPASSEYSVAISHSAYRIAAELKRYGVLGRFSIDFISVKGLNGWIHYGTEINLRKGGTTHPYLMLLYLTSGTYDAEQGIYFTGKGQARYYLCSDNVQNPQYRGLTPHDLIDIATCNDLLYDSSIQEGVMFHLISALSQFGKLGLVCIGSSAERARFFYNKTVEVLNRETGCPV